MRLLVALLLLCTITCTAKRNNQKVLIFTENGKGFVHKNIAAATKALTDICEKDGFKVEVSDDSGYLTENIDKYDLLIFNNTNNEVFDNDQQRDIFKHYIQNGGGFVGVHIACGTERNWPWFNAMIGGRFVRHPKRQKFDIHMIDQNHQSTKHLPKIWQWEDECYFMDNLNPDINVLFAADLTTVTDDKMKDFPGNIFGTYFPLAWYHKYDGGVQWYTALGHTNEHYDDPLFREHLRQGILWVAKEVK
ncbi:ThuA domain-containing protein [Puteibacter caeruleilacunae]|nr:ThuA domain-containing protein [Puteibacter caeruleilacunae]